MMNSYWIQILIGAVVILHSCSCEKRLIEYAPPWQPVAIPAAAPQLISIGNFDASNKAQIAQIAHHNAQILRQIKGLHPPVTQYLNPFPVFPSVNSPKHVVMTASALPAHHVPTTQHLLSSSSNVAQTMMPQTVMESYFGSKPTYISAGKPSMNEFKFYNGMASSSKIPPMFLSQASSSMPSLQLFTTTSRVPILRDVTMSSQSSMFKSTQLPNPPKFQAHMTFGAAQRPAASNQIPGQILSSFTHFGPAAPQILRGEPKQRIRANFLTAPFDHYHFANPYAGHLTAGGHFVAKNNFANSLYFPHNGLGSYQLTNTFIANQQKPNSQPFVQQSPQQHGPIPPPAGPQQLPETQPSYLPQLPTVPPSVLSPFFQVQQKQQDVTTPAPQNVQESPQNSHSNTFLLNDEYTINLVPPPPYKHTDSTRFRLRQPLPPSMQSTQSTQSTLVSLSNPTTNSTPIGPHGNDVFDDEQKKAMDILNKYNIPAISPLQDANRYAYNSGQFSHSSTTTPTPSYSDDQIFQRWPVHDNILSNSPSFTTEKPNIFRNLNRPSESEYHQHKLMHPGYTGPRKPSSLTTTPFLPTQNSLNNAITHSFFTIEDAITISPHSHYRRPVKPTNTNEIEESIKRPSNDIYIESTSIDPFHGFGKDTDTDIVTMPPSLPPSLPPPSVAPTLKPRNKLRRKRPRPTTESISTSIPYDSEHNQIKNSEFDDPINEVFVTEMPKNHKEYTATRDRGQLIQYTRETTTNIPRESSSMGYRNSNRVRNRTRLSTPFESRFESSTTTAPIRSKRPYNPDNRRPNNRFEGSSENKSQRYRPVAEKSTRHPLEENEQTTIGQREYSRPSRRPLTTQQAIPISTTLQDETETNDFFFDTKLTNRIRNSSPSTVITTSLLTPTIDSGDRFEENSSILSTRLNVANEPLSTHEPEDSTNNADEDIATLEPQTQDTLSLSSSSSSSSSSSPSSTSISAVSPSSTLSEKSEISNESIPSNGPVYIRDENKLEMSNFRTRQRMRNKEKILEAVAAATSSQTKAVTKDRGHGFAHHNEVNDIENESSSTEKDSRLRVRLPIYKAGTKQISEEVQFSNATKAIRLNGTNKFDPKNRPRFSIKEYRQRMSSTAPTPDQSTLNIVSTTASYTRLRFPTRQRFLPSELKNKTNDLNKINSDEKTNIVYPEKSTTEPLSTESVLSSETTRKRFIPKDRYSSRLKTTTETIVENQTIVSPTSSLLSTVKPSLRRASTRRDSSTNRIRSTSTTTDNPFDTSSIVSRIPVFRNGSVPLRRPQTPSLRQRIQNKKNKESSSTSSTSSTDESLNDLAVEGSSEDKVRISSNEVVATTSTSTEEYKHETAIMKIAKDDHSYRPYKEKGTTEKSKTQSSSSENDLNDSPSEQSERVAELTIFGSNQFNSVNTGSASRRIPGYFTLATEDPILPIEAFFPQVKRNK